MQSSSTILLGIDPGSNSTGYGLIHIQGSKLQCLGFGQIQSKTDQLHFKLHEIFVRLSDVIQRFQPSEVSIEQIFTCHNHQAALKLGQARGVALAATAQHQLPIFEYSAKQVKKAVVGYGAAAKTQIQAMVMALLKLADKPPTDAADALAIAICHASYRNFRSEKNGSFS